MSPFKDEKCGGAGRWELGGGSRGRAKDLALSCRVKQLRGQRRGGCVCVSVKCPAMEGWRDKARVGCTQATEGTGSMVTAPHGSSGGMSLGLVPDSC